MLVNVYMPKGVIRKGDNVLIVKNIAKDWASLKALMHIMETVKAKVWGALIVVSVSDVWRREAERYGIRRIKVLKEFLS